MDSSTPLQHLINDYLRWFSSKSNTPLPLTFFFNADKSLWVENDFREIVQKGKNSQIVAISSEGIATHGDPVRDVPLLLNVYEKIYGNDDDEKIELALSKLTGLTLPEGSPPEEWKRNWNLKADRGPAIATSSQ